MRPRPISRRDCPGDVGMEPRDHRQVAGVTVVHEPESPREARHQRDRLGCELVAVRLADQHVELAVETHETDVVVRLGALLHLAGDRSSKRARSSLVARVAADRAISRSSSRRTSSIRSCFLTLNSETRTPRRGSTVTSPSRARRCSASRTGVRPMPKCLRERPLGEHLAGLELQRADHLLERDVRTVGEAAVGESLRSSAPEACSASFKHGSSHRKRLGNESGDRGSRSSAATAAC